ncbi:AAA family ATPase [Iamia majanohamensis]|uniref:AAA family ATPase n=1 Tax=Iamia majanohamensis TaxID=467976 RepID=A0AAF0BSA5_9ACTN|nr:AAA family ATPase [Iamia majanohamensis]WCO65002.1 AAA family ATPase [Iamia majanohamensis]
MSAPPAPSPVDLEVERSALARARAAVRTKLDALAGISGGGADALADEYIDAVVRGAVETLQQELVVFGRIDDDRPWRVGLYGIDEDGDQLVVDWRSRFAGGFYQARFDDPMGLARRVTYVGAIADLFVEDFARGEVTGSSPLMAELARSRGTEMRAAVATLQSEQDELVRLPPTETLVLRGGPGTGKTVVGLHRAAWLVYNDTRLTAGRILVVGPSDRFLRFVSAVLPTLGEARVVQTTFDRLLGPSTEAGSDERWLPLLDRWEDGLYAPAPLKVGGTRIREAEVAELVESLRSRPLPWRDRRKVFLSVLANRHGLSTTGELSRVAAPVWPTLTTAQAWRRIRSRSTLRALGADPDWVDAWLRSEGDGALHDEVRARVEGVPSTYGHVIVDEAQDMTLLQLRAVRRRATGVSLVGDDAQRSVAGGIGLRRAGRELAVEPAVMATAYRMSAEIADWLNVHAARHGIDAVELVGIRPTGVAVGRTDDPEAARADLAGRWPNVALITAADSWEHKGVEYDAVVVDARGMDPARLYLAASRAAHELVVAHSPT